ncbi:hypothetical protein KIPB_005382 [Kipferlia bialata]|uniref:Uncharacterized protein n=1 Tax=Kipferlia bialata TaxID=797122 RepID=A0A9K3CYG0_9EUKA|nr:hypothetical protein KIPB_005382 [Kipferlia bialata]|eukprot:g5382.t1
MSSGTSGLGAFDEKWQIYLNPSGSDTEKTNSVAFIYYTMALESGQGFSCSYTSRAGTSKGLVVFIVLACILPLSAVGYLLYRRKQGDTSDPLPGLISMVKGKAHELNEKRKANASAKANPTLFTPVSPMPNSMPMPVAGMQPIPASAPAAVQAQMPVQSQPTSYTPSQIGTPAMSMSMGQNQPVAAQPQLEQAEPKTQSMPPLTQVQPPPQYTAPQTQLPKVQAQPVSQLPALSPIQPSASSTSVTATTSPTATSAQSTMATPGASSPTTATSTGARVMSDADFQMLMMRQQMAFNQTLMAQGKVPQMQQGMMPQMQMPGMQMPMGMGMGMQPMTYSPTSAYTTAATTPTAGSAPTTPLPGQVSMEPQPASATTTTPVTQTESVMQASVDTNTEGAAL